MDHAVTEWRGADVATLGLADMKAGIGTGAVPAFQQFALQVEQPVGHLVLEGGGRGATALAAGGVTPGQQQIIPSREVGETHWVGVRASLIGVALLSSNHYQAGGTPVSPCRRDAGAPAEQHGSVGVSPATGPSCVSPEDFMGLFDGRKHIASRRSAVAQQTQTG